MSHLIERLGRDGDGIAAGPVHVALALPGEIVDGEVRSGRIPAPTIVRPSPERVRPPCAHFGSCGGCSLQHASDALVESWKEQAVRDALSENGLPAPIRGVRTSPPASRRRAVFSGRRIRKRAVVGFHARASEMVVDTPDCVLLAPGLMELRPALERMVMAGASRRGELRITVISSRTGADICAVGGRPADVGLLDELARIAADHEIARIVWNGELAVQMDAPVQDLGGIQVVPPPGAFLQPTVEGESALMDAVVEAVGQARRVVDLFAGCGTLTLPIARIAEVHAVDSDMEMLHSLDAAWRGGFGLKRITTEVRDLFRRPLIREDLAGFDIAVADPPRAGARAQAAAIGESDVACVTMVSCNPVTFARDARLLSSAGFRIEWIDVIDQFRWSTHVELVARLSRG